MLTQQHETDKRERLIEATRRLMLERGVAGCTTKEIARAAGVAEGTIYNQFRDKADLYLSVAAELMPQFLRQMPEDPDRRRHPRALLVKVATETLDAMKELVPLLAGIVAEPELLAGAQARFTAGKASGKTYAGLTGYFREEQAAGRIGAQVDATVLARMFIGTVFNHAFMRLLFGESNLELTGRRFVESLVDGVLAAAGPAPGKPC